MRRNRADCHNDAQRNDQDAPEEIAAQSARCKSGCTEPPDHHHVGERHRHFREIRGGDWNRKPG